MSVFVLLTLMILRSASVWTQTNPSQVQASSTNLVQDSSFENPVVRPGGTDSGYRDFGPGNVIASAWTVVGSGAGAVAITPDTELLFGSIKYNAADANQAPGV